MKGANEGREQEGFRDVVTHTCFKEMPAGFEKQITATRGGPGRTLDLACMPDGSWLMARGSWLMAGLEARGSWPKRGARPTNQGPGPRAPFFLAMSHRLEP